VKDIQLMANSLESFEGSEGSDGSVGPDGQLVQMVQSGSKGSNSSVSGLFESSRGRRRSKPSRDCPNSLGWFRLVRWFR